ncbi:MAG: RNA polymerase sigma factor [Anaerorhabdus sp.]
MRHESEVKLAIDKYADMIRKICFVQCKNEADVDDVFQNVFIKYYQHDDTFASEEHEKAWIIRVTINACHDLFRGMFQQKVDLAEDMHKFSIDVSTDSGQLISYVRQLKTNWRNAIYLHYYEGYSVKEVAQLLRVNEGTIATWIHRGKKKLKTMIGGDFFD